MPKEKNLSPGAYYRQLKQCREKILKIFYSIILLQSLGASSEQSQITIQRIAEQISVILASKDSDIAHDTQIQSVMSVIDQVVKKMSNV